MQPSRQQYAAIHCALTKLRWDNTIKESLVYGFTQDNGKVSLRDLSFEQASALIKTLNEQIGKQTDDDLIAANSIRRRIIAIAYQMHWYRHDANGRLILLPPLPGRGAGGEVTPRPKLDYARLDSWLLSHSAAKKKLNEMNAKELNAAAVQINQYYLTTLKAK